MLAEPLDHLLADVQKMSETGSFLLALLHDHSNPIYQAQRAYTSMVMEDIKTCSLTQKQGGSGA